jgi:hypothetical protein
MKLKLTTKLLLFFILFIAALFRLHNVDWDQGAHLHPDERAIILAIDKLSFPQDLTTFFSPESPWNPHFFAYGSFPFYLLYFVGQLLSFQNPAFAEYSLLNIPGRFLSTTSDLLTILVLFFLGKKLFGEKTGLLAAFFYGLSVLAIQLSHFYAVDTLLTLFILLTLYQLILFYEKPTIQRGILIGIFFGLALATKVSALVLIVSIGISLVIDFLLLFIKAPHKKHHWKPHLPAFLAHFGTYILIIPLITVVTFLFVEPYALIDFQNFWQQTIQQSAMTKSAFTFPYTLQYVGKIPYFYELKNVFLFGLGPILATLAFIGFFLFTNIAVTKDKKTKWAQETILLTFFIAYFFTVGKFAVGFMRYMLPLYPLFCLFAALCVVYIIKRFQFYKLNKIFLTTFSLLFVVALFIWPLSFNHIYGKDNTRTTATAWIKQNIPPGKLILVEHWDDRLPISGSEQYVIEDLQLYNPDTDEKWQIINNQLQRADYLIVASNRLSTPLQKLINCTQLPHDRCYQRTAIYYAQLFSEKRGYKKIAEFTNYPTVPLLNKPIDDQSADESFTVYDHPKIMIFKKD